MKRTFGLIARTAGVLLLVGLIAGGIWLTRPWRDLQTWRWYTLPFESLRAGIFTHWEVIQPVARLQASTNPRRYQRNLTPPDGLFYTLGTERIPLTRYLEKANVSGLMVLQGGEVKLEYYARGLDRESRNHIWSASKSFTATLAAVMRTLADPRTFR